MDTILKSKKKGTEPSFFRQYRKKFHTPGLVRILSYGYTKASLELTKKLAMDNDKKQTLRQEIMSLLKTGPMTVREISQSVRIMEKDVYHHLPFIEKTLKHHNQNIGIIPCYCRDCGFEFKKRKSFKKPGKCPACRDGRIASALLWIP